MSGANQHRPVKLTDDRVAELLRLRAEDPETWTEQALADRFGVHNVYVSQVPLGRRRMAATATGPSAAIVAAERARHAAWVEHLKGLPRQLRLATVDYLDGYSLRRAAKRNRIGTMTLNRFLTANGVPRRSPGGSYKQPA